MLSHKAEELKRATCHYGRTQILQMPLTLSILLTGLVCYEFSINFLQFEASIKLLNDLRV